MQTVILGLMALIGLPVTAQVQHPIHVADFSKSDSPQGLAWRGSYVEYDSNGQITGIKTNRSTTGWYANFFDGHLHFVQTNPERFACLDVGTGLEQEGLPSLPRPLARGGATIQATLDHGQGHFGPYELPFSFRADFEDLHSYLDADIHQNAADPAWVSGAGDRFKTLAIVVEFINQEGPLEVERQAVMGFYTQPDAQTPSEAGPTMFGPWTPGQTPSGAQEVILPPGGGALPFDLRVLVSSNWIYALAAVDCPSQSCDTLGSASLIALPGGTPLNILRVTAASLRVAGARIPASKSLRCSRIEISSPNIAAFDGELLPTHLPENDSPILRRVRDRMLRHGIVESGGVNSSPLLGYFAGMHATPEFGERVLDELVQLTEARVIRFSLTGMYTEFTKNYSNSVGTWPKTNFPLLDLWKRWHDDDLAGLPDPDLDYFNALDRLIAAAAERDVLLIPTLVWGPQLFLSWGGGSEGIPQLSLMETAGDQDDPGTRWVRQLFDLQDPPLGAPAAEKIDDAREYMEKFVKSVVERYADRPEIAFWEVGNEWDLKLNRRATPTVYETTSKSWSESALQKPPKVVAANTLTCLDEGWIPQNWPAYWNTPEECRSAQELVIDWVRSKDSVHMIGSGHAGLAAHVLKVVGEGQFAWPDFASFAENTARFESTEIDLISHHTYFPQVASRFSRSHLFADPSTCSDGPENYMRFFREIARGFGGGSQPGRVPYMGETDSQAVSAFLQGEGGPHVAPWLGYLDAMTASSHPNARLARLPLVLMWTWMIEPSVDPLIDHNHAMLPEHVTMEHPLKYFALTAETWWAKPRVVSAGISYDDFTPNPSSPGTGTFTGLRVEAIVEDPQKDVAWVELRRMLSGGSYVVVTSLQPDGDGLWVADLGSHVGAWTDGEQQKFRIAAGDGDRTSIEWPRLFVGAPEVPTPAFPATTPPSMVGSGRGEVNYPIIRRAGFLGKPQISVEGSDLLFVAEVIYPFGKDVDSVTKVYLRPSQELPGTIGSDWAPWATLFPVKDDGVAPDQVAGDDIFTMVVPLSYIEAGALNESEFFFEALPVNVSSSGVRTRGDIWPYFTK
jgi:hypothetical protein